MSEIYFVKLFCIKKIEHFINAYKSMPIFGVENFLHSISQKEI